MRTYVLFYRGRIVYAGSQLQEMQAKLKTLVDRDRASLEVWHNGNCEYSWDNLVKPEGSVSERLGILE